MQYKSIMCHPCLRNEEMYSSVKYVWTDTKHNENQYGLITGSTKKWSLKTYLKDDKGDLVKIYKL